MHIVCLAWTFWGKHAFGRESQIYVVYPTSMAINSLEGAPVSDRTTFMFKVLLAMSSNVRVGPAQGAIVLIVIIPSAQGTVICSVRVGAL